MYKTEFERTWNFLYKHKKMHLYIAKYASNLVNKKIISIEKFQPLWLKSFYSSS